MSPADHSPARAARDAVPFAAYAALAATETYLAGHPSARRRRWRTVTKPLLMPALMAAFVRAVGPNPHTTGGRPDLTRSGTLLAQGLSAGGDVALLFKTEPAFLAGVGSFFGAHVAYTATFVANGRPLRDPTGRGTTLLTLGAAGSLVPGASWLAGRRAPALRGPVAAYAAMITAMVGSSTRLCDDVPARARRRIEAGSGLFLASDSILAVRKFVVREPRPWSDAVVMATYTAGQGLIALGLAQVARAPRPAVAAPPARVEETDG